MSQQAATTEPAQPAGGNARFLRTRFEAVPLPIPEDDAVPSRIKLAPWGTFDLRDKKEREGWGLPGTLEIGKRSAEEIPKNFDNRDIDFSVNERHGMSPNGDRALGWLEAVEVIKGDGLYLSVDWTDDGRALLESKTYRYASGEMVLDVSDWMLNDGPAYPIAITGLGLTNNPAVKGFEPLMTETLDAALSGLDGRGREGNQPSGDTGQKGACRMDGTFWKGLFTRVAGREPKDELDAATAAAETCAKLDQVEKTGELEAKLEASAASTAELTAKLATVTQELADIKTKSAKEEVDAVIDTALASGKLAPSMKEWAVGLAATDRPAFDAYLERIEEGAFAPPPGRQVGDKAINSPDTVSLSAGGDRAALDADIKAHMAEHKVAYHEAAAAVTKGRQVAAGTGA